MTSLNGAIKLFFMISTVLCAPNFKGDLQYTDVQDDAERLVNCKTSQDYPEFSTFQFKPRSVPSADTACLSLQMFKEMGFVDHFKIPLEKLSRFILVAQQGYRKVPYHSWDHGFAVLHFSFAVLKNCKYLVNDCFMPLEGLALLTAAMCHDLDHPGTNSKFQEETNSPMAQRYKEQGSILERHHIEKTFNILRNPESDFIGQLSDGEQHQFKKLIEQIILATDLKRHFAVFKEEQKMASEGFEKTNERHRHLLHSIIITSADLSDGTKDWRTARKTAKLVITEFFNQGDKEKELGILPEKMMDRRKANIPEEQANFISFVVRPVLSVLVTMCPEAQVCMNGLEQNLKHWQALIPYFAKQMKEGKNQLDLLDDQALDETAQAG